MPVSPPSPVLPRAGSCRPLYADWSPMAGLCVCLAQQRRSPRQATTAQGLLPPKAACARKIGEDPVSAPRPTLLRSPVPVCCVTRPGRVRGVPVCASEMPHVLVH